MAALACLMLAGCNNQEEPTADGTSLAGTPLRVTTEVADAETRQEMKTDDLKAFYLRVTGEYGGTTAYNYFAQMTKSGNEWVTEDGEMLWKADKARVGAVAQQSAGGGWEMWSADDYDNGRTVQVLIDQSGTDDARVKASDLLYMPAAVIDPTNFTPAQIQDGKLVVGMKHAFAKLEITVSVGNSTQEVVTGQNPITALVVGGTGVQATFKPAEGTLTDGAEAAAIAAHNTGYIPADLSTNLTAKALATYECIVLPQEVAAGAFTVTATIDGTEYVYTHSQAITFAGNKKYTLALNVGSNKLEVSGDVTVGDFEDGKDLGGGEMEGPEVIEITPTNEDVTLTGGNGEKYLIKGDGTRTEGKITIDGSAEVTLSGVNIHNVFGDVVAIEVTSGTVTFILEGENRLESRNNSALYNAPGSTIILQGEGTLTAVGGYYGAGIGSYNGQGGEPLNSGLVRILSGRITATTDGSGHAGIGASFLGNCEGVEILGGTVIATGGLRATGIGAGYDGSCESVKISGGTVTATAGEDCDNAIGNGYMNGKCASVTLSGNVSEGATRIYLKGGDIAATTTTPDLTQEPAAVRDALTAAGVTVYLNGETKEDLWPSIPAE